MTRVRLLLGAVMLIAVALTGCGGSPDDDPLSDLRARVAAVNAAVDARDPELARLALDRLREAVDEHQGAGRIDWDRAETIIRASDYVRVHLRELEVEPGDEGAPDTEDSPEESEAVNAGGPGS